LRFIGVRTAKSPDLVIDEAIHIFFCSKALLDALMGVFDKHVANFLPLVSICRSALELLGPDSQANSC